MEKATEKIAGKLESFMGFHAWALGFNEEAAKLE